MTAWNSEDHPRDEAGRFAPKAAGFRVEIDGEYGINDGAIYLMNGDEELVMWDSAEWREDPSLVYVIANAIRKGFEEGPDALRIVPVNVSDEDMARGIAVARQVAAERMAEHPDTDDRAPRIQPTDAPDYDEAEQQEAERTTHFLNLFAQEFSTERDSDDPYCAKHGQRFDPAVGCPGCLAESPTS